MCKHTGSRLEDGALHGLAHAAWSRRQFMRGLALAGAGMAVGVGGTTVHASAPNALLRALAGNESNRILVLIQLSGGNDGLNTIVPFTNDLYHQARPGIRITSQNVIPITADLGLHPSLAPFESLLGDGKLNIIQNVGYASPELSHFMSTDVWLSGKDANNLTNTGWSGRYLETQYPDYHDVGAPGPVGLQIGGSTPLLFQANHANLGVTFPNVGLLERLTTSGSLYDEDDVPATPFGAETSFVRRVSNDSFEYAQSIKSAHTDGTNTVSYPGSSLGRDLSTIARLIRGNLGSKIYHVTLGGFDTHANQAGTHTTLLRWLSQAVEAFVNDLSSDGLLDRVCGVTFSEFGRRIAQNGSSGTDHGTSAPMFVFGGHMTGEMQGSAPDLGTVDGTGNMVAATDFRSVYGGVLRDWFGMQQGEVDALFDGAYPEMSMFAGSVATNTEALGRGTQDASLPGSFRVTSVYPNPMRSHARVGLELDAAGPVRISLVDMLGRTVAALAGPMVLQMGSHQIPVQRPGNVARGAYVLRVEFSGRSTAVPISL